MSFLDKLEKSKSKKTLLDELDYYKLLIIKKLNYKDFKSALEKSNSAIILIQEYADFYNLKKEHLEFTNLKIKIKKELKESQKLYFRRYNNLLKENLTESNLENFSKLLAMLKDEIDEKVDELILNDLCDKINLYFKIINRVYTIVNTYKILNYYGASQRILDLVKEIKNLKLPNIKALVFSIYQNLLSKQLESFSYQYEKLSLDQLSNNLALNSEQLLFFIDLIIKMPNSPIKRYNSITKEVMFKK